MFGNFFNFMLTTHSGHHTEGSGVAPRIVGPPGRGHVEREAGAVVSEVEGWLAEVGPAQVREPHHEPPPVLAVSLYGRAGPHEAVEAQVARKVRETLQVVPSQLLAGSHGLEMSPEPHWYQDSPGTTILHLSLQTSSLSLTCYCRKSLSPLLLFSLSMSPLFSTWSQSLSGFRMVLGCTRYTQYIASFLPLPVA